MYVFQPDTRGAKSRARDFLTPERVVLYSAAMLVLYVLFMGVWVWTSHGFTDKAYSRPGLDFSVFWSASYAMQHGPVWQIYNYTHFEKIEHTLFSSIPHDSFLPWLYPPTFLALVTPLALVPPVVAYILFIGGSASLYVFATLRLSRLASRLGNSPQGWLLAAASPCVFVPAVVGQNSLLTAALAALAVHWIARHPARCGLCIGLLAIKPQMALLFPFVLIAARAWRTLGVAALSASLFGALAVLICGKDSVPMFLANTGLARGAMFEHGYHYWLASPTTLAVLRVGGVPLTLAYAGEACVALIAVVAACHVWKSTLDVRLRGAALTVATLIANPYVWHYELTWLGVAIACLAGIGLDSGWRRGEQAVLAIAWLLPFYEYFNPATELPQIGPIVLLLMLLLILRRVRNTEAATS